MRRFLLALLLVASAKASPLMPWVRHLSGPTLPGVAAGPSYLINEGFEGTGTPTGWIGPFGAGSVDFHSTAGPLVGAKSLLEDNTAGDIQVIATFALQDEVWGHFIFRPTTLPASFTEFFVAVDDVGFIDHCKLQLLSTGVVAVTTPVSISQNTVGTMSAATIYDVWWHWKVGTGANAIAEVWFNTVGGTRSGVPSNNHAIVTNGSDTAQCDRTSTFVTGSSIEVRYDTFQVSSTDVF